MDRYRLFATAFAVVVVLFALAAVGTAAAESADGDLELVVSDDGVVSVEENGSAVENATVDVTLADETDENVTYGGVGEYTTDADGAVDLPAPDETVAVDVTATTDDASASVTAELEADESPDALAVTVSQNGDVVVAVTAGGDETETDPVTNASVDVALADEEDAENVSYAGTGDYSVDENGTVELPPPDETVAVTVTATLEEDGLSDEVTATLEADEAPDNFGALVSAFVAEQRDETDGGIGSLVSEFVTENNPGNASDAGPPDHAGPPGDGDGNESIQGPPGHAGPSADGNESTQGPPEHAGSPGDDGTDSGQGPPDHAGP
ncbi:collagen-like protein [Halobiforma nitratireducens]|uniref:Uncharacterized protein n=1 Tax=Halobiforma nitratireducens JCM 10879 TaxID=1227454 RepID=M0LVK2_9EURY|nr:collagen-like protein [Halobiforma nitratireducens]EMA37597.1 hypothetical protein C446_10625 [Halobiforma nitratireducens JCM 10879]